MPTLAWTWTTLRAALQAWPVDQSAAYVANLDTIIGAGELRLVRDLNLDIFDDVTTFVIEAGDRIIEKPATLIVVRSLRIGPETFFITTEQDDVLAIESGGGGLLLEEAEESEDTRTSALEHRSWDYCHEFAPDPVQQGRPRFYNELNERQWEAVPTADRRYGVLCHFVRRPADTLSTNSPNETSWLSRSVPDALFVACLMEAEHYLKADDRYADMRDKYYNELLPAARLELRALIKTGEYSPMRPSAQKVG